MNMLIENRLVTEKRNLVDPFANGCHESVALARRSIIPHQRDVLLMHCVLHAGNTTSRGIVLLSSLSTSQVYLREYRTYGDYFCILCSR